MTEDERSSALQSQRTFAQLTGLRTKVSARCDLIISWVGLDRSKARTYRGWIRETELLISCICARNNNIILVALPANKAIDHVAVKEALLSGLDMKCECEWMETMETHRERDGRDGREQEGRVDGDIEQEV